MTTSPIRVGIVGLGAVTQMLIHDFRDQPQLVIHAVCDIQADLAATTAARLGAAWSTDYRAMLAANQVDLVYVAVPPREHHRIVLDVLAAGKHILCEKPLALHLAQAQDMATHAQTAGVIHALNLPDHSAPGSHLFGAQIAAGVLGTLLRVDVAVVFPQWPRAWQRNPWVGGRVQGGPIREFGPPLLETLLRYFGPIARVLAHMEYPADRTTCEQGALGLLQLASGPLVAVNLVCNLPRPEAVTITAYGTRGTLGLNAQLLPLWAAAAGPLAPLPVPAAASGSLLENLAQAIRGEAADLCGFEVGVAIQAVLVAWEQAAYTGTWVPVEVTEAVM